MTLHLEPFAALLQVAIEKARAALQKFQLPHATAIQSAQMQVAFYREAFDSAELEYRRATCALEELRAITRSSENGAVLDTAIAAANLEVATRTAALRAVREELTSAVGNLEQVHNPVRAHFSTLRMLEEIQAQGVEGRYSESAIQAESYAQWALRVASDLHPPIGESRRKLHVQLQLLETEEAKARQAKTADDNARTAQGAFDSAEIRALAIVTAEKCASCRAAVIVAKAAWTQSLSELKQALIPVRPEMDMVEAIQRVVSEAGSIDRAFEQRQAPQQETEFSPRESASACRCSENYNCPDCSSRQATMGHRRPDRMSD